MQPFATSKDIPSLPGMSVYVIKLPAYPVNRIGDPNYKLYGEVVLIAGIESQCAVQDYTETLTALKDAVTWLEAQPPVSA